MQELTADQISEIQEALRAEIRQKQELLKAYDLVREHMAKNGQTQPQADVDNIRTRTRGSVVTLGKTYGENTRIVTNAIKNVTGSFTIRDIHNSLSDTDLTVESVTTVFNSLREKGLIRVVLPGKGRRPTIFKNA